MESLNKVKPVVLFIWKKAKKSRRKKGRKKRRNNEIN
jgi:hypothetical protein